MAEVISFPQHCLRLQELGRRLDSYMRQGLEVLLMPELPCQKYSLPCPYIDRRGKPDKWTCCGLRGGGERRLVLVEECPDLNAARAAWAKMQRGKP